LKLFTYSYDDTANSYNDASEDTNLKSYELRHMLNAPAECKIVLRDKDGTVFQKYNADSGDVYIGSGRVELEDPNGTDIFEGLIKRVEGDSQKRTVTLYCKDFICQLDDEIVTYDMREDLDGSGLRESSLKGDLDSKVEGMRLPVWTYGSEYFVIDDNLDWDHADYDDMKLLLTNANAGSITITVGPHDHKNPENMTSQGWKNLWVNDANYDEGEDTSGDCQFVHEHYVIDEGGSLFESLDAITVTYVAYQDDSNNDLLLPSYSYDGGTSFREANAHYPEDTKVVSGSYTVRDDDLSGVLDSDGMFYSRLDAYDDGVNNATVRVFQCTLSVEMTVAGYSSLITINETFEAPANFDHCWGYDASGPTWTDETADMTDDGANDVNMLPAAIAVNDAFYFGSASKFGGIILNMGTAGDWAGTCLWKYWDGDSWEALSNKSPTDQDFYDFMFGGWKTFRWDIPADWATTAVNGETHYWIQAEVSAVTSTTTQPKCTQGFALNGTGNLLKVGTNCAGSGLGLWTGAKYCIVQPIYKHIDSAESPGDLITDGGGMGSESGPDRLVNINATTTVEHTSGYSSRQYIDRTRFEILQDLAAQDKAEFWMTLGGNTFYWKSTWNEGSPTAMTDKEVNWWRATYDFDKVYNEARIYGMRMDDEQLVGEANDTTSQGLHGIIRTVVEKHPGLVTEYDVDEVASAVAGRNADAQMFLACEIDGLDSTYRLATEVSVTSTYLNLSSAVYVVVSWMYDSGLNKTQLLLHPRVSTQGLVDPTGLTPRSIDRSFKKTVKDKYVPSPSDTTVVNPS
jgi:hypothetical protein